MTVTTPPADVHYTVQPGDWLSTIAPRYGEDWHELYADNEATVGRDPDRIFPGQVLAIHPGPGRHRAPQSPGVTLHKHDDDQAAAGSTPPTTPPPPKTAYTPPPAVTAPVTGLTALQQAAQTIFGGQYQCAADIIQRESGWNVHATNPSSGAYGLPQALPGSKMASAGPDWRDNGVTQLHWMLGYVDTTYGGACGAWSFWQKHSWY